MYEHACAHMFTSRLFIFCCFNLNHLAPAGNPVPRKVASVTLKDIPLDVLCESVGRFESVEDFKLENIRDPAQVWLWYLHVYGA